MAKAVQDYGKLTNEKAIIFEDWHYTNKIVHKRWRNMDKKLSAFFSDENKHRMQNAWQYLESFLQNRNKRLSDLVKEDLRALPRAIVELIGDELNTDYLAKLPTYKNQPKRNDGDKIYRVASIRWNKQLEHVLAELLPEEKRAEFIRENAQLIWEKLGVTSFAAHMKAQELEAIPKTVKFDPNGTKTSLPTYPLIEFDGYQFRNYDLRTMDKTPQSLDAHMFTSPVHRQNLHANIPLEYKGIKKEDYKKEDWEMISTVAAYLFNPNMFIREEAEYTGAKSVYKGNKTVHTLSAPDSFEVYPRILPVRADETALIAQLFLPARESKDSLSITDAVLRTRDQRQVYLFKHEGSKGKLAA